jgi:ABC-type bacteriocin/lantibiotic exporter with double-glycine peptidase domain
MKEFGIYTGLRATLFAVCFGVLWFALNNWLTLFPLLLLALILSSILSIFVLRAARDRLAGKIEHRAAKISHRLEQARTAEDDD